MKTIVKAIHFDLSLSCRICVFCVLAWTRVDAAPPEVENSGVDMHGPVTVVRGRLVDAGGPPTADVFLFFGLTNGGDSPEDWSHRVALGPKPEGVLQQVLIDLEIGFTYYYRWHATNSTGQAWAPTSSDFLAQTGFTPAQVQQMADEATDDLMAEARSKGVSTPQLVQLRDLWDEVSPTNWSQYVQTYNVQIQHPDNRLVYDLREGVTNDWSTLTNAVRTYERALWTHDTSTLFAMADTTGAAVLESWGMSSTEPAVGQKMWYTNATRETWLFVSRTTFEGDEYRVVFLRREHSSDPTNSPVVFPYVPLKKVDGKYLLTGDLKKSEICAPWSMVGVPWPHTQYTNAYNCFKETDIPAHFYTIE